MKILVISHMYPSNFNMTSGIFVHEQVKTLVRQGHEVKVISPIPWAPFPFNQLSKKWNQYSKIPRKSQIDGIEVFYTRYLNLPHSYLFEYYGDFFYLGMKNVIAKLYQTFPFELIHAHVALPDGVAAIKLKEKFHVPFVVTIHGQDLQHTIYRNKKCKAKITETFQKADKIILVSSKLKRIADQEIGYSSKSVVIHNGMNLEKISSTHSKKIPSNERMILSVSNLYPSKGIDLNLYAVSKLKNKYPNLKYYIVGDGPERDRLRKLAEDLQIKEHVKFLGRLPHEKALEYMQACEIFSLPSWKEGFGIAYIEAMAFGKPVIGVVGEGIEDVIQQGVTGVLVKPKDVESLVKALDDLLSDPTKGEEMGQNARKMVYDQLTWKENVQQTIDLYKAVLHHGEN
ncbi:glycosyltransferase family 4 protein [Tepidibacillus fermentans]|uniref:Glycosyltransferase involved in cell wall biosynthesis n=1 Tax=Tepidibacillus fermentans TaxID=1281767 RepID=A0A4R3KIH5_9BACI|nr:glycosyltransferase family 4 protein [Tepidibacillus fermentans]TCS83366.1 glycosyltransferase involved in cell wall biosynthesis [Tepidibacillus fermentans]